MADDEDIAALVVDNGSGMCKGELDFVSDFVDVCRRQMPTTTTTTSWSDNDDDDFRYAERN